MKVKQTIFSRLGDIQVWRRCDHRALLLPSHFITDKSRGVWGWGGGINRAQVLLIRRLNRHGSPWPSGKHSISALFTINIPDLCCEKRKSFALRLKGDIRGLFFFFPPSSLGSVIDKQSAREPVHVALQEPLINKHP